MNNTLKKCLALICCGLLSFSLTACNTTDNASTNQHPEGKTGEFGGNGEHDHDSHPKNNQ